MSSASLPPAPPPELAARIRAAIAAEAPPSRVSRVRMPARVGLAVFGVAGVVGVAAMLFRVRAVGVEDATLLVVTSVLATLLAVVALASAVMPGRSGLGLGTQALAVVAVTTPVFYCALTMVHPVGQGAAASTDTVSHFCSRAIPCLSIAAVMSIAASLVLLGALRHAVPVAPRLRGAVLGAATAAWAGVALHLHCPQIDRGHLLVAHAMPIVLFALLGAWLAPRLIKP